VLSHSRCKP